MNKKRSIAWFMIFLVLTLPVFSSAQFLSLEKYSGKDNINGIVRDSGDKLSIEVKAKISDSSVEPNNVVLLSKYDQGYLPESFFDNCEQLPDGYYKCTYSETDPLPDNYRVQLADNSKKELAYKDFVISTDESAPEITFIDYLFVDGKLKINYKAEDKQFCSGIKTLDVYFEKGASKTTIKNINGNQGDCVLEGSFEVSYSPSQQYISSKICAKPADFINQVGDAECTNFIYDKKAPEIKNPKIISTDGYELTHLKDNSEKETRLVAEIDGDDADIDGITADLSSFNSQESARVSDEIQNGKYYWDFTIKNTNDCKYTIKTADKSGNTAQKDFTCTFALDNIPPTIKEVKPTIIGKEGNITAFIEDLDDSGKEGIGISKEKIMLVASSINSALGTINPDECAKSTDKEWRCDWIIQAKKQGTQTMTFLGSDNLGNEFHPYEAKIEVDLQKPEGLQATHSVVGGRTEGIRLATSGDEIIFTLSGDEIASATADLTGIGGSKEASGTCTDNKCTFTATISKNGEYTASIKFTALDTAGNKENKIYSFQVYGLLAGAQKSYWNIKETVCYPKLVDRTTASVYPMQVYCEAKLESSEDVSIADMKFKKDSCTGDIRGSIEKAELWWDTEKENPTIIFSLTPKEFTVDSLKFSCPITIYTKKGTKLDKNPETQNIAGEIRFYNLPLKDIYASVDQKIDKAIKATEWDSDVIEKLKALIDFFERICKFKTVLVGTIGVLAGILFFVFPGLEKTVGTWPVIGEAIYALRVGTCTSTGVQTAAYAGIFPALDKFCTAINCKTVNKEGASKWNLAGNLAPKWCQEVDKFFESITPEEMNQLTGFKKTQDINTKLGLDKDYNINFLNVKESIVWSSLCLCIPGIVHNLDKYKQIQCRYATCLIDDVKKQGFPTAECTKIKQEMTCAFVFGEIWNTLPLTKLWDMFFEKITKLLTDPIFWASFAVQEFFGVHCSVKCIDPHAEVPAACYWLSFASAAGEAYSSLSDASLKGSWTKPVGNDYCAKLDDLKKERKR